MITLSFPTTDGGLLAWSVNVLDLITPVPATYGLVSGDVTSYQGVHDIYASALGACDPNQRNKTAVVAKNAARTSLKTAATLIANKIYADANVTDAQKVELGMPPRSTPTQIPAPIISPVIEIISSTAWTVRVRLLCTEGRGLPPGCFGAAIFTHVGESAPADISDWKFQGNCGRVNKIDIPFDTSLPGGTKVWLVSFYFNGRKQSGPLGTPISTNLPGGSVSMAA